MTNKARDIRVSLGLTQKEAGQIFFGQSGRKASDAWAALESRIDQKKPIAPATIGYLDLICWLKESQDVVLKAYIDKHQNHDFG